MASAAEQLASNLNWGSIGRATELKKRLWFTVAALVVFRIGAYIPVPGVDPAAPGAGNGDVTSVDFGSAIAATVPYRRDRSNFRRATCGWHSGRRVSHCIAAHDTSRCRQQCPWAHGGRQHHRGQRL